MSFWPPLSHYGLSFPDQLLPPGCVPPLTLSSLASLQAQVAIVAIAAIALGNIDRQARGKDWIVDLCLDVLQASWWISFASLIPFRAVYVALRGASPHTAAPLSTLQAAVNLSK